MRLNPQKKMDRAGVALALLLAFFACVLMRGAEARSGAAAVVVTVSAASFEGGSVAPDAIVAAFGVDLAPQILVAGDSDPEQPGVQLPTELAGTSVEVAGRRAELLFVSPGQINYIIPPQTPTGTAQVSIRSPHGEIASGAVNVMAVCPGVFTANSDGHGWAAALALRLKSDQSISYEPVVEYDAAAQRFIAAPIDLGEETDRVFLVLFATGVRHAPDANGDGNAVESVRVVLGGSELTPVYAGPHPDFIGLDQINVELPRSLIGRGEVSFTISANGSTPSNLAQVVIAGEASSAPPQVTGFGIGAALAGQTLVINGNGFYTTPGDNIVRIGGIEAEVMAASATQLTVVVPFGAETGVVRVRTAMGEGASASLLQVRTSISGFVENTAREPMSGVRVQLVGTEIAVETTPEGSFVLPDVPTGTQFVDIDGESVQTTPPYPKVTIKAIAVANRDNQFARPIALQQSTGGSGNVGNPEGGSGEDEGGEPGGSPGGDPGGGVGGNQGGSFGWRFTGQVQPAPIKPVEANGFSLIAPQDLSVVFPGGATAGTIFLTPVDESRVPVDLPRGIFSSGIVQVAPFNVQFNPGVKLIFPNTDRLPAGATAKLFRYDPGEGEFVEEPEGASVSADGMRIETSANAVRRSSYYFVARPTETRLVLGRVLESDRRTPVRRAVVSLRGQEIFTDGNGGYMLRYVPVLPGGDSFTVDASFLRPSGRVERAKSLPTGVIGNTALKVSDIILPPSDENRPPVILGPLRITLDENESASLALNISDPDGNAIERVTLTGPPFASIIPPPASAPPSLYELRLTPGFRDGGEYQLTIEAFDPFGARAQRIIPLIVRKFNRAPIAMDQDVTTDEDIPVEITLNVMDPDDDMLSFRLVESPEHGTLSGTGRVVTYTPERDYFGTDRFTYRVNDGTEDSNIATVTITVRPVNDAPRMTVPDVPNVREGERVSFTVLATDPDPGQKITFGAENLPTGATFVQQSPTSAVFTWQPNFSQAGVYLFTLTATDDGTPPLTASRTVRIVVLDSRRDLGSEPADLTIFGATSGESLGAAVAVGDLDNDGLQDLVVGSSFESGAGAPGRVRIFFSGVRQNGVIDLAEDAADATYVGELAGDRFGSSIAIGDFNGDGRMDLAVGAPRLDDLGRTAVGAVYIIFGPLPLGTREASAIARTVVLGANAGDRVGASLSAADLNGDGKVDLVIGAPGVDVVGDAGTLADAGAVYTFFGGTQDIRGFKDLAFIDSDFTLLGTRASGALGSAIAAGDFDGDGSEDLAAGAPFADFEQQDQGVVYVILGAPDLAGRAHAAEAARMELRGRDGGDRFGTALAFGDVNLDGRKDLVAGAPGGAGPNNLRVGAGEVYVYLGASLVEARPPNMIVYGAGSNPGSLGASLAVGDFTGDGIPDLVMGAPSLSAPDGAAAPSGVIYLIFGSTAGLPAVFDLSSRTASLSIGGVSAGDRLGLGGLTVGDLDNSGIGDLILGVPRGASRNDARPRAGEVHILRGVRQQ
ncbi:MAG: FG-GAP repeat protein [Acidobacteria bacterium]|nr:FG-GAP repeat protein [Acidobacteriota bacterium]